jgi:hypothetical protein
MSNDSGELMPKAETDQQLNSLLIADLRCLAVPAVTPVSAFQGEDGKHFHGATAVFTRMLWPRPS